MFIDIIPLCIFILVLPILIPAAQRIRFIPTARAERVISLYVYSDKGRESFKERLNYTLQCFVIFFYIPRRSVKLRKKHNPPSNLLCFSQMTVMKLIPVPHGTRIGL